MLARVSERKKRIYEGVDLTIIAPSEWIKHLASQSILKEHPYSVENCLARAKSLAWTDKFSAYCDLYLESNK